MKYLRSYLLSNDAKARQIVVNSDDFDYTGIDTIKKTLEKYGAGDDYTKGISDSSETYETNDFYTSTNDMKATI